MKIRLTAAAATATLLGSIGLYPLFIGLQWFLPGFGAILVVSAAGLFTRWRRLPTPINVCTGLAGLFLYVTMLYAGQRSLAGIVPTPQSLSRLTDLIGQGWQVTNKYAAPVPYRPGVALLTTLGIGLVAAVVDFLAVQLRRAAVAGLPLLAMYSVPAAVREISWLAFLFVAIGFMGLLLADSGEKVSGWGRTVFTRRWSTRPSRERLNPAPLIASGYRLGLTAVAIAVLMSSIVRPPGMFGWGGKGGSGAPTVTTPDPLVSLRRELTRQNDTVILTYRTTDREPPDYLRMYALDRFDGNHWTYSPLQSPASDRIGDHDLPSAPGLHVTFALTRRVTTQIRVDRRVRHMRFLPMPYPPTRVDAEGEWWVHAPSLMVYSLRDTGNGRTYTVHSLRVEPTPDELIKAPEPAPQIGRQYLERPAPERIQELAVDKTKHASSPYEKAVLLQQWFARSGEFTYDLSQQPPRHVSDLEDFLTVGKRGSCEQFAAAMALLARVLGIPARVAVGYTAGTRAIDGSWIVRSRDAHAWPELYFEGTGWVRFEPTPAGNAGQGTASVPSYTEPTRGDDQYGQTGLSSPIPNRSVDATATISGSRAPRHRTDDLDQALDAAPSQGPDQHGTSLGRVVAGLLIALLLAAPAGMHALGRRRRWRHATDDASTANAAWMQLRVDAIDHGLPWRDDDSPRATARRLTEHLRLGTAATRSLGRITQAEERARYARSPAPMRHLPEDSRLLRNAFARSVSPRTRWRARLMPPSALMDLRRAAGRALVIFDVLSAPGFGTWEPLRRRGKAR